MKRPPTKLRELRLQAGSASPMTTTLTPSSNSMFSRVPLLLSSAGGGDQVPGLLIPFAFLSTLRANLQISAPGVEDVYTPPPMSAINSPNPYKPTSYTPHKGAADARLPADSATIQMPPHSTYSGDDSKPYPQELPVSVSSPVTISTATTDEDTASALELIADTVASQRQIAAQAILFNPGVLATTILLFLTSVRLLYTGSPSDLVLMMTVWTFCSLAGIFVIRLMTRGYLDIMQKVGGWPWLSESSVNGASQKRDEIFVARYNGDVVGVLVLRIAKTLSGAGTPGVRPRSSRRKSSARWTGIIRAWSVRTSYTRQGIGTRLLEKAVSNCRLRALDGPIFADDHANSNKVLPGMFNGVFEKREKWARAFLEQILIAHRGY